MDNRTQSNLPALTVAQIMDLFPRQPESGEKTMSFQATGTTPLDLLLTFFAGYAAVLKAMPDDRVVIARFLATQSEKLISEAEAYLVVGPPGDPAQYLEAVQAGRWDIVAEAGLVIELAEAIQRRAKQLRTAQAANVS